MTIQPAHIAIAFLCYEIIGLALIMVTFNMLSYADPTRFVLLMTPLHRLIKHGVISFLLALVFLIFVVFWVATIWPVMASELRWKLLNVIETWFRLLCRWRGLPC